MCGICGSLHLGGGPVDAGPVRAMLAGMAHRGPDAEGLLEAPGIAAGIRRLAVIDVAGGGQPIANEDGTVEVIFNGEIYNYRELRATLEARGHRFRTSSDTETLVHLWEEHGPAMLERLNGMFALCVHDRRSGESFLARDRMGIKPLFFARLGERIAFASEIAVLLRDPEVPREVDPQALVELFCLQFVGGGRTVWRGVLELPPGHALHVRDGEATVSRWWSVPEPSPEAEPGIEARAAELLELLRDSVRYRMIADVPLGVFLSGGLDSSTLAALAAAESDRPLRTFSVGFEGAAAFDEREHAALVAAHLGAEHRELVVSAMDIADHLPRLVEHLALPVTDPALIPTWLLSQFARREVTVALSGEGADELFAGYRRYAFQRRFGWLGRLPGVELGASGGLDGLLPRRVRQALASVAQLDPARNHLEWSAAIGSRAAAVLFTPEAFAAYATNVAERFAHYFAASRPRLAEQLRADQLEWLPHNLLAKVDRASMAHSLEARVPFLDHRIVEWAARLPDDQRIRGAETKVVLRRAARALLPAEILARPKRGFDLPLAAWLRGPLRPLLEEAATPAALARWPGLEAQAARRMIRLHLDGAQDFGLPLFNLLSVLLFLERVASRARAT